MTSTSTKHAKQKAAEFTLLDHSGTIRHLSDYRGTRVLLVFYPKDRTPCCQREKIALRDKLRVLRQNNIKVVAITHDQTNDHVNFVRQYVVEFPLLVDSEHTVAKQYGVLGQKSYRGTTYTSVEPQAVLIGASGLIEKTFPNFDLELQALSVLKT